MLKDYKNIVILIFLTAWFFVVTGFITKSNEGLLCKEIKVNIIDSVHCSFVKAIEVRNAIIDAGYEIQGYPVQEVNIRNLENLIEENPYVKNAEVYTDIEGSLFVDVFQRKPVIRVMPNNKPGFYIDNNQVVLPLARGYTPNVLLVTGYLDFKIIEDGDIRRLVDSEDEELNRLLEFSKMVNKNTFWSNQIVQIYRAANGDFEIIPRVGAHQIIIGSLKNFEKKLTSLEKLYNQGFNKYGWNKYDKINLKYSNQIICTKRKYYD